MAFKNGKGGPKMGWGVGWFSNSFQHQDFNDAWVRFF
jgi:hypothetical protein